MKDETRLQWWQKAITLDFMSSEESADSSDGENERFIVKPIPWRSEKVTDMLKNLYLLSSISLSSWSLLRIPVSLDPLSSICLSLPGLYVPCMLCTWRSYESLNFLLCLCGWQRISGLAPPPFIPHPHR